MKIEKISFKGKKEPGQLIAGQDDEFLTLEESYSIGTEGRAAGEKQVIELKDDKLVEMVFEDGTRWFSNSETLEDLYPEAAVPSRSGDGSFDIPTLLRSHDGERSLVGDIALKFVNVFTKKAVSKGVAEVAEKLEKALLDNKSGLYRINRNFELQDYVPGNSDKPHLLFLHGTASSTKGSFGKMTGTKLWDYITKSYGNSILGFQHESLSKSPLQNVMELVKQLPQNITLHIISHSRGGLVGDILSRFCTSNENLIGFDSNEIRILKDHAKDVRYIDDLKKEIKNKKISVKKFIRVACPAAGTTLASKRLDTYFNIISNLVGFATGAIGNPVYSGFKNLIAAVIDTKNDPDALPGIEAMNPKSSLIKALNLPSSSAEIDNPLTIISGNSIASFSLRGLLAIVSKLFYFTDNDMVVDTGSMYKGSRRAKTAQYFLDESADVDHLHYFRNETTNKAILDALSSADEYSITGFKAVEIEKLRGTGRSGFDSGQIYKDKVTGTKPIVILLPGIMGSNLTKKDELIWINYDKFLAGDIIKLSDINSKDIKAASIVKTSYSDIVDFLSGKYDVVTFPYDWRLHLDEAAKLFNDKIEKLFEYKQPIKIIGHSMGGLVVRDFILNHKETWDRLNQSKGFKLIFLGTPLGGSYRIPMMLFGNDPILYKLDQIDSIHNQSDLQKMFSSWPGLLCLLPHSTDKDNDFSKMAVWNKMSNSFDNRTLPSVKELERFKQYRDKGIRNFNDIDFNTKEYKNIIYIAGQDRATPCGYRIDKKKDGEELIFLSTGEGDSFATWESAIPKKINSVFYADVTHGELASEKGMFRGIEDILESGSTNLFSKTRPDVRSEEKLFRSPEVFDFDLSAEGVEKTILGIGTKKKSKFKVPPIKVSISNGDLKYASYPILAGHFLNDGILYAEKSINFYLNDELTYRHRLGIYPGVIGSSEIFIPGEGDFKGAIIVGMGVADIFTAYLLTQTIEQGVSKYLLNLNSTSNLRDSSKANPSGLIGISSLIIGSGYAGLSIENSVRAIVQGVKNANDKLLKMRDGNAKTIQHIEFIELYKNNALRCLYSLIKLEKENSKSLPVLLENRKLKSLLGKRDRIALDTSEGWWNRITVKNISREKSEIDKSYLVKEDRTDSGKEKTKKISAGNIRVLQFNTSTGGAREEQRELRSSIGIVDELMEEISVNKMWTPETAKTVFELLIPNDFKDQLKRQGNINFILDKDTASYPWELLQDSAGDVKPLCINAGMIRQLATQDYRIKIKSVSNDNALIIGDPNLKGFVNQLPGALKEGQQVSELLEENGYKITDKLNKSAPEIIQSLFSEDYKIVHLAGHGFFDKDFPESSGMVIGPNRYLTTMEISQMSTVPELVFVNCCYLGKTDGAAEELYRSRYKLAANIGTQLIENGVKAVVAAGWEVNDSAALEFAGVFYKKMFEGNNFGDSILSARQAIYSSHPGSNTWGAYQCYGDPFYKLKSGAAGPQENKLDFKIEQQAEIELDNLLNDLEAYNESNEKYLTTLNAISNAVNEAALRNAVINEKEALIYSALGEYNLAVDKFADLLTTEDAQFSLSTVETYFNIRAKKYINDFLKNGKNRKILLQNIEKIITDLKYLITLNPSARRYIILGSTYKRKSMLLGNIKQKIQAYEKAAEYYHKALLHQNKDYEKYALINCLEMESLQVLASDKRSWNLSFSLDNKPHNIKSSGEAVKFLNNIKDSLRISKGDMKFWDMLTEANIKLCLLIIGSSVSGNKNEWDDVFASYRKVWSQAGSRGKKITEIEYLEFWIDALSNIYGKKTRSAKNVKAKKLWNIVKQLKEELEKLI